MSDTLLRPTLLAVLATPALLLGACADDDPAADAADDHAGAGHDHDHDGAGHDHGHDGAAASLPEVRSAQPRVAITHEGGVLVLDGGEEPKVLADLPAEGYLRLNAAGDGRHAFVTDAAGFRALDLGSYSRAHGDHFHHHAGEPSFTGFTVPAEEPGHVVGGPTRAVLFDDAGQVTEVRLAGMAVTEQFRLPAHHGIAVREDRDRYLTTLSDGAGERIGVALRDGAGEELERHEDCPGAHGAAEAAGGAVVVGCADGALVHRDGTVAKAAAPGGYGRIGTEIGVPDSPLVLADYRDDEAAARADRPQRPTRVAVVDTRDASLRLVDLGTSYSFRSLAMTEAGIGVVLGTDGALHLVDPAAGAVTGTIEVIGGWTEPEEWQRPRPALAVAGDRAYVTDPAARALHIVDLAAGEVTATVDLPGTPDEILATAG
ncbi:hypothetical protein CSPHI_07250 [Corynebacterium sphenisci DSM 44792]|uniref:ABC transporter n=1 Tax=Corynebacterium sphenisci DSM 44792 TaxID=1437874 RepID=A0A1L7CYH5_9CORY|nr:hypothetical protein [Corynebacterium sphenisci]APT90872.1 hypothetical protein CSPHI_07250 [Corynebacterium sphenisci DSM 44792]